MTYVRGSMKHLYLIKPICNFCQSNNVDKETLTCYDCGTTTPMVNIKLKIKKQEKL